MVAGHSIGEYAALVAAGAISFDEALPLVRRRGQLMEDAGMARPGAMAAVIGLSAEEVVAACRRADKLGIVDPANFNSPSQVVISGETEAVQAAAEYARDAGAKRVVPLNVSGAFHSRLMVEAAEKLGVELRHARFRHAAVPVVANFTASPVTEPREIKGVLARQILGSVRWEESVRWMLADGVDAFVELGPGNVLAGLVRRIARERVKVHGVADTASLEGFLTLVRKECRC